jgi:pyruvate dehydrogenase E2 component (dihydrolipoamide acetyltransferase)
VAQFYEMPAVSPTMEVGTLVSWKIAEGQPFESSAVVAEVGTDKANMDAEIFDKGVLIKHLVAEGDEVPPGYPIAIWGASKDEDISELLAAFEKRKAEGAAAPAPEAKKTEEPKDEEEPEAPAAAKTRESASRPKAEPAREPEPPSTATVRREWGGLTIDRLFLDPPGDLRFGGSGGRRVKASPLARKVAKSRGVDLARTKGTGPGGRITRADVERGPTNGVGPAPVAAREDVHVKHSQMRRTIAKRLLASHTDVPTFFLTATFDVSGFVRLKDELKVKLPDLKVSYNDMLVLAVARALRDHPEVNASWADKEIVRHGRIDIGIAVAIEDGLVTPVLRDADRMSLSTIAGDVRELAGRARTMKLDPSEYTGGTFTISNLGMFGIEHFTAIINPPEAAILAVGAIEQVPVVERGQLTTGWRMKVTMTCDHRVIDGAVGAAFLQTLRRYVETPWFALV